MLPGAWGFNEPAGRDEPRTAIKLLLASDGAFALVVHAPPNRLMDPRHEWRGRVKQWSEGLSLFSSVIGSESKNKATLLLANFCVKDLLYPVGGYIIYLNM